MPSISPTFPQRGGSHENDGHCRRRRRAWGANNHEIRGDLNCDCDFISILPSGEVIFVVETVIALRCRRRWRSRRRRQKRSRRTEISTVSCRVAHDVKFLSPRHRRNDSIDCAGNGPPATWWKVGVGGEKDD
ncbi:hypothetical protein TIFTF001_019145 [Ficus carica]|uniref:Uncharacterized protein n=1 Tax=Ficus carica TaxID=3494 RepID=A0AA88AFI8_FICCA|nr:hypothetical protein TIFTF001_019145 [Ficus carica]